MKRLSLSGKILLAAAVNALLVGVLLVLSGAAPWPLDFQALLLGPTGDAVADVSRRVAQDLTRTVPEDFDRLLARYSNESGVTFLVWHNDGFRIGGPAISLPAEVLEEIRYRGGPRPGRRPGKAGPPPKKGGRTGGPPPDGGRPGGGPPGGESPERGVVLPGTPPFLVRTGGTPSYWIGSRIPVPSPIDGAPTPGTLLIASDGFFENPFLRGSMRWVFVALAAAAISIVCWAPLLRGLTRAIRQLEGATSRISDGRFDVRVDEGRGDELGRLGRSINRMATRIDTLVTGQTRFLADTAHELRSPLGRMRVALGLLETRVTDTEQRYVRDLNDDVDELSHLTDALLQFARTKVAPRTDHPTVIPVADLVDRLIKVEARSGADIRATVARELTIRVYPGEVDRALGNVLRNAIRYAGTHGPITVTAEPRDGVVEIAVADCGPGVPPEEVDRLFAPFYRLDSSRDRRSGGVGLGLAIARSSIEACGGQIMCRNRTPNGLEVRITLPAGKPS